MQGRERWQHSRCGDRIAMFNDLWPTTGQIPDTSLPFGGRKLEMWLAKSMDDEPGTQLLEPVIAEGIMVDKRPRRSAASIRSLLIYRA